jgi:hypothetical protein
MADKVKLSWLDRLVYRFVLIPIVRKRLLEQRDAFAWTNNRPTWGPGRIDPFNPVKFGMLRLADDGTIGNSDMQAIWNLNARERIRSPSPFHWDGLNDSLREVVISSALGDGAVAKEFSYPAMERIERFLRTMPAPPSPHRPDAAAVERGKVVFAANCGECHAFRRQAHAHRDSRFGGRHGRPPVADVDRGRARRLQQLPRRPRLGIQILPQEHRLRRRAARRLVAQRAISPQRLRSEFARPSGAPPQRPATFVRGLDVWTGAMGASSLRPAIHVRTWRKGPASIPGSSATAMADTSMARAYRRPRSPIYWPIF